MSQRNVYKSYQRKTTPPQIELKVTCYQAPSSPDIPTESAAESAVAPLEDISIEVPHLGHEHHQEGDANQGVEYRENLNIENIF